LRKLNKNTPYLRNSLDDRVFRTGKNFILAKDIKPKEISGPTCGDYIVITPNSVDTIYSVATDLEYPNGLIRLPLITAKDRETLYSFPKFHGGVGTPYSNNLLDYVEDPEVINMVQKTNGEWDVSIEHPLEKNPHRAFLRILATVTALFQGSQMPNEFTDWEYAETANAYERMGSPSFLRSDLKLVNEYLEKHKDPWITKYLDWVLKIWPNKGEWHWK